MTTQIVWHCWFISDKTVIKMMVSRFYIPHLLRSLRFPRTVQLVANRLKVVRRAPSWWNRWSNSPQISDAMFVVLKVPVVLSHVALPCSQVVFLACLCYTNYAILLCENKDLDPVHWDQKRGSPRDSPSLRWSLPWNLNIQGPRMIFG